MQFAIVSAVIAQDSQTPSLTAREETALRAAAENVADSVVQIRTIGGLDAVDGTLLADGPTTGLVISADGYIISSAFNFVQQPSSILVTLASGKQARAELVATDHSRMLVLLKVAGVADLPVPAFAPAEEIRPGQWAIAVGRTFRADRTNVSVGIVSALGRMFGKVIQTDADVSTANYGGPLVDIRGRVLGLVVPMAPQEASQVAGAEWYDSGIGFAVPLSPLAERIERLKEGKEQRAGILGVGLGGKNPHSSPAKLSAVRPDAPAGQAGLKKGDRIVEVDGVAIRSQTDLRFALGPRYGGDKVRVVARRGDERLERTITLAGELPAFRHAFLGILPMRSADDGKAEVDPAGAEAGTRVGSPAPDEEPTKNEVRGVAVRMTYGGSPAAETGILAGDQITRIDETQVDSIEDALEALNNAAPGSEVALRLSRGDETLDITLTAARLPTSVPGELPPAFAEPEEPLAADKDAAAKAGETIDLKLPEYPQRCKIYVPPSHASDSPQAALFWLHAPDEANADDVIAQWRTICDRDGVLLIVPTAAEKSRWERTELEYLRRLSERVIAQYHVDPRRVVAYGEAGGGSMAWLLGLSAREVFRGLATSAAPLPRQIRVPENEPAQRLSVFAAIPGDKNAAARSAAGLQEVSQAGYPVTTITTSDASGRLTDIQREELARWIDSLDRF